MMFDDLGEAHLAVPETHLKYYSTSISCTTYLTVQILFSRRILDEQYTPEP